MVISVPVFTMVFRLTLLYGYDLQTKGFELEIAWRDRAFNSLNYGIRFVLSDAQAKITRYSNPSRTLNKYYAGMKWGQIWGYESIGIARSDDQMLEHLASLPNGGQSSLGSDWQAGDIMFKDVNKDVTGPVTEKL